jgi:hypothetical protein
MGKYPLPLAFCYDRGITGIEPFAHTLSLSLKREITCFGMPILYA